MHRLTYLVYIKFYMVPSKINIQKIGKKYELKFYLKIIN